jgi:hypothetical protein
MVLQYSDDLLHASDSPLLTARFVKDLTSRFDCTHKPHADWYLQARIRQDHDYNTSIDQIRYSKAIIRRYLPTSPVEPTPEDVECYKSPLPYSFKWTKEDNSSSATEVETLESAYGFRFIEVVGSLNFLTNTIVEELFAVRKACKHMHLPGTAHFKAIHHLLHHLRCHPPKALMFYSDATKSPLADLLQSANLQNLDPSFIWFSDSSFGDCDDMRSTGCSLGLLQGGVVDASSFVPDLVALSTAESENNAMCVAAMKAAHVRMIVMELRFQDAGRPYTVPLLVDSSAANAMTANAKDTKRTRHIER